MHDPIFGGHFVVTWNLPGNVPVSFSEAPKRADLGSSLQCAASTQQSNTSICLGTMGGTGITIASTESSARSRASFRQLQPNVDWVPADTTPAAGDGNSDALEGETKSPAYFSALDDEPAHERPRR